MTPPLGWHFVWWVSRYYKCKTGGCVIFLHCIISSFPRCFQHGISFFRASERRNKMLKPPTLCKIPLVTTTTWRSLLKRASQYSYTCSVAQLSLTLCSPMDCSPSGFSVHGILQARILEWGAISSSRGSSQSRDWTHICLPLAPPGKPYS